MTQTKKSKQIKRKKTEGRGLGHAIGRGVDAGVKGHHST